MASSSYGMLGRVVASHRRVTCVTRDLLVFVAIIIDLNVLQRLPGTQHLWCVGSGQLRPESTLCATASTICFQVAARSGRFASIAV